MCAPPSRSSSMSLVIVWIQESKKSKAFGEVGLLALYLNWFFRLVTICLRFGTVQIKASVILDSGLGIFQSFYCLANLLKHSARASILVRVCSTAELSKLSLQVVLKNKVYRHLQQGIKVRPV